MLDQQRSVWQAYQRPKEWPVGWKTFQEFQLKSWAFYIEALTNLFYLWLLDMFTFRDGSLSLFIANKSQMPAALFFSLTFHWPIRSVFSPWEFPDQFQTWEESELETAKGPSSSTAHKLTWANRRHKSSSVPKWGYCRNMALSKTCLPSLYYNYFHWNLYHLDAMLHGNVSASRAVKSEFFSSFHRIS